MKKAIFALVVAIGVGVVGASQLMARPSKAAASTFTVDQGAQQCSGVSSTYKGRDAIALAIAAASDGSTIKVCPGRYDPVVVDKPLTIIGTNVTLITPAQCITPNTVTANDSAKFAIVDDSDTGSPTTATGLEVAANVDGVTIQNLTIQNRDWGVDVPSTSNKVLIRGNVIQNNQTGIRLAGGTQGDDSMKNKVQQNCIRRNNFDDGGNTVGTGIFSEDDLYFGKIEKNTFYKNTKAGGGGALWFDGSGDNEDVSLLTNTSNGDAHFLTVVNSLRLIVNANTGTGSIGDALIFDGGNLDSQLTANSFTAGLDAGLRFLDDGNGDNEHLLVSGNTFSTNDSDGIVTGDNAVLVSSVIGGNKVQTNGDHGINLANAGNTQNFVINNTVSGNGLSTAANCVDTDRHTYHNTWLNNGCPLPPLP
jgi:hypothetical protein